MTMKLKIEIEIDDIRDDLTLYKFDPSDFSESEYKKWEKDVDFKPVYSTHSQTLNKFKQGIKNRFEYWIENYFEDEFFEDIENDIDTPLLEYSDLEIKITVNEENEENEVKKHEDKNRICK